MLTTMPVKDALRAHLAERCTAERCTEGELHSRHTPSRIETDMEKACPEKAFGEHFTLDGFLSNKKNFFPLAVAREVISPQKEPKYNPLVYYGKSGSGKTHLLRAIAGELNHSCSSHAVFYGDMSSFIQECDRYENGAIFDPYRAYCIDDIHFFANNASAQAKLLNILDLCLYGKKQFVCACSGPLTAHKGFSEQLRSRLELGIIVEVKTPDIDVRMLFAKARCVERGLSLAPEDILFLAQQCAHLRYLSAVLLKISAYNKLTRQEISRQDIKKILKNSGEYTPVEPQDVIRQVAEYFSLSPEEITGKKRTSSLIFARRTAMYLCRKILGTSYPALGQVFGGKNHSTVMYHIKKIEQDLVAHKDTHTTLTKIHTMCVQKK